MKYLYQDLSDSQFETLILFLCQSLLGISVQCFSSGRDGGRDAKFIGTAQMYPSTTAPWTGTVVIQAKHTNGNNRSFSESDFFSIEGKNTIIAKEIPRIKSLIEKNELHHYMLFSNRRLSAIAEIAIRNHISEKCGLPQGSIFLCGTEMLEIFLKKFPEVATLANLDPIDSPLTVSADDLSRVIEALAHQKINLKYIVDDFPTERVSYEDKNRLNNMTKEYANAILKKYLKDTAQIRMFLTMPENKDLLRMYESIVDEFDLKIIAKRKDYQTFDNLMEYLADLLFSRDPVLCHHKSLVRLMLFYMYWNCDIGEVDCAKAD